MNNSKILLARMINSANKMNHCIKHSNEAEYKKHEELLNFAAEIATDMGFEVHVHWRPDGQIDGIQCGKSNELAAIYETI